MPYQVNTAKDSAGNEHEFVAEFIRRQREIQAYKAKHGGDLESAFQAVTGVPWPKGRSVKIGRGGVPEMTKDRTLKSVLGKYVAPIGAAALTGLTLGGAAPTFGLFGGGAGGTAGAGAAGGVGPKMLSHH